MTPDDVLADHQTKLRDLAECTALTRSRQHLAGAALALTLAITAILAFYAFRRQIFPLWPALPVPLVLIARRRYRHYLQSRYRLWRLTRFYDSAVQRAQHEWAGAGITGEEFSLPGHAYSSDLNVLGEGSLFELLCIARTSIGRRGLADFLLVPPPHDETLLRQDAVREMRDRVDLREQVATLGEFEFSETKWSTFEDWLNTPQLNFPRLLPAAAAITSTLLAALLLTGLVTSVPWGRIAAYAVPLVAFHAVIGLVYRARVNRIQALLRPVSVETQVLREGLHLLEHQTLQSAKLRQLAAQAQGASNAVRHLERLLDLWNERNKDWFYAPSLLLLAGTQLCMATERWRAQHGPSLQHWLQAWADFEALNALAAYAYENPDHTFPEFTADHACLEAQSLGHPLLPNAACIRNDVELNLQTRFYVLSGSNMSGKSTLLRAIGLASVLARAGAPVRSKALRHSPNLSVFASLSITDSLLNGKSKFQAEVDRLRQTIDSAEHNHVLFLIDEIFSGTKSRDRRIAAEAIVRTLTDRAAVGVLSTHDLALTEIAHAPNLRGRNVHMGSRDGTDPMDFDYRLKPGITQEANALVIARMAGVPVSDPVA